MRRLLIALLLALGLSLAHAPAVSAAGAVFGQNSVCSGQAARSSGCQRDSGNPVNEVLRRAVTTAAVIAGAVAVVLIVIGGFLFVTSAGDPAKAETARKTVIYALVGLLVAGTAASLVTFVISRLEP